MDKLNKAGSLTPPRNGSPQQETAFKGSPNGKEQDNHYEQIDSPTRESITAEQNGLNLGGGGTVKSPVRFDESSITTPKANSAKKTAVNTVMVKEKLSEYITSQEIENSSSNYLKRLLETLEPGTVFASNTPLRSLSAMKSSIPGHENTEKILDEFINEFARMKAELLELQGNGTLKENIDPELLKVDNPSLGQLEDIGAVIDDQKDENNREIDKLILEVDQLREENTYLHTLLNERLNSVSTVDFDQQSIEQIKLVLEEKVKEIKELNEELLNKQKHIDKLKASLTDISRKNDDLGKMSHFFNLKVKDAGKLMYKNQEEEGDRADSLTNKRMSGANENPPSPGKAEDQKNSSAQQVSVQFLNLKTALRDEFSAIFDEAFFSNDGNQIQDKRTLSNKIMTIIESPNYYINPEILTRNKKLIKTSFNEYNPRTPVETILQSATVDDVVALLKKLNIRMVEDR